MANDADAAERTVNGSTTVLPPSANRVTRLRDRARARSRGDGDARTGEPTPVDAGDEDKAGEGVQAEDDTDDGEDKPAAPKRPVRLRLALVFGVVPVLALAGLAGWFGYGANRAHQEDNIRNMFLAVGKQGALNLTTINYTQADADIQRILESSTGQFYDDFSRRAPAFVDVVKQSEAKTDGSIVEAGLESVSGNSARVLVAVLVKTSNKGATDQQPRHWRMRIDVQKVGDTVKVANVGFVP